jgi:hypothetical protein
MPSPQSVYNKYLYDIAWYKEKQIMSWQALTDENPELAELGRMRLHGRVSYLATIRLDGGPRVHPVTPFIGEGRLFVFMEPTSPKGRDIRHDGRYALHCGVEDDEGGGGEFLVWGRGRPVIDSESRALAVRTCPYRPADRYILFELGISRAMHTSYDELGPVRHRWRSGD